MEKLLQANKSRSKVVVKPTWEEYEKQDGDLIIELDPGMALEQVLMKLQLCIQQLENMLTDTKVFDIGCGSGYLL